MHAPRHVLFLVAVTTLLAGCMVGPTYDGPPNVSPVAKTATAFHRVPVAPVSNAPTLARWWPALHDETLNRIEEDALANSPTLEKAMARIRQARATLRERRTDLLPTGGASAIYAHAHLPSAITDAFSSSSGSSAGSAGTAPPSTSNSIVTNDLDIYNVGLTASWEVDLFGGVRRKVGSAKASAKASDADLQDAQVTLTKDVANAYVHLRDAQRRLALAKANTAVQERILALTRLKRAGGTATDSDVERIVTQLKQTEADAVPLQGQVEIYTDQLGQLAGHEPGAFEALLTTPQPLPAPPAETAVGNPGDLVRRRPDIRAAERRLAAANETIGADIADYYPSVTLYGTLGVGSNTTSNLFSSGNVLGAIAPVLSWNFLNFPSISAKVEGARGSFDEARASYRSTVLQALLDAENALSRFGHQRDNVASLVDASASATRSAKIADLRYRGGTLSLGDALDTERQRLNTQSSLAEAQASLTLDWIGLQSSLGLGWSVPPSPAAPSKTVAQDDRRGLH